MKMENKRKHVATTSVSLDGSQSKDEIIAHFNHVLECEKDLFRQYMQSMPERNPGLVFVLDMQRGIKKRGK